MDRDTDLLYESFMTSVNEANEDYAAYKKNIEIGKIKNQLQSLNQNIYNVSRNPGAYRNAKSYIDSFNKQRQDLITRLAQIDPASANAFASDKAMQAGAMKTKLDDISQTDKAIAQAATGSVAPTTAQASANTQQTPSTDTAAASQEQPVTLPDGTPANTTPPAKSDGPAEVMNYPLNPSASQQPPTARAGKGSLPGTIPAEVGGPATADTAVKIPTTTPGVSMRGTAPELRPEEPVPAQASANTQQAPTFKNWVNSGELKTQFGPGKIKPGYYKPGWKTR